MPRPSAIWVCESPNCCRILRKRGPTNSFLPALVAIPSLAEFVTKVTKLHITQVCMLHDITIHTQAACTKFEVWRLATDTFRNALSRMSIGEYDGEDL